MRQALSKCQPLLLLTDNENDALAIGVTPGTSVCPVKPHVHVPTLMLLFLSQ